MGAITSELERDKLSRGIAAERPGLQFQAQVSVFEQPGKVVCPRSSTLPQSIDSRPFLPSTLSTQIPRSRWLVSLPTLLLADKSAATTYVLPGKNPRRPEPGWQMANLGIQSQLAMGWLATLFGGAYYASSGSKKPASAVATPPINASSSDEADFIKCVIYPGRA